MGKNQLVERLSGSRRRRRCGFVHITDRKRGANLEIRGNVEFRPGALGVESAHEMRSQPQSDGFQSQICRSRARVVQGEAISRAVMAECLLSARKPDRPGGLRPLPIPLEQQRKDLRERLGLVFRRQYPAPWLFVETRE